MPFSQVTETGAARYSESVIQFKRFSMRRQIQWIGFSLIIGVLAGSAAAIFLNSLEWASRFRDSHRQIIWALPLAGLAIVWAFQRFGQSVNPGINLIIDEIHDPKNVVPLKMAPLILAGTLLTHLFGGSAGREGTAVQMSASLADQLSRFFSIETVERKILLVAGAGAGFGAAIGTPWAGVVFGMEVIHIGRLKPFAWIECFIASFTAYYTAVFLGAHHSVFSLGGFEVAEFSRAGGSTVFVTLFYVALAGALFGLTAACFIRLTHLIERLLGQAVKPALLRPFVGGLLLVFLFWLEGSYRFIGLGISEIQRVLSSDSQAVTSFSVPLLKSAFTALTVGSGFKGGEFIPLVFIGTTLGGALSLVLPLTPQFLGALGFAAVFAGAANVPITCTIMACELFGFTLLPYALVACFFSYYFSGHPGIYRSQKYSQKKLGFLRVAFSWLGELPKRFF